MRLGRLGPEADQTLERHTAVFEFTRFLLHDAQIVPGRRKIRIERHRAATGVLTVGEQPLLPAHFSQIAVKGRRRARRLARLAQMGDRQIQISVRMRHQAQKM